MRLSVTSNAVPWSRSLVSDRRGSGFVQMIILMVALAIALLAAVRLLGGGISDKMSCTGDAIVTMTPGGGRCAEGGEGGIPGAVASADEGAGDPRPGANPDDIEIVPGDPGTGQPGTGQPGDPGTGQPGDPGTGQPGDPGTGQPGTGDPGTGQPGTGDPGTGQPGTGDPGTGQPGTGQPGTGQPGSEAEPGAEGEEDDSGLKVGGEGGVDGFNNGRQTNGKTTRGGAPPQTPEEAAEDARKRGVDTKVEVGVEKTIFEEEGALGQTTFAGGSETLSGGFATGSGKVFANASLSDGVAAGGKVEGKASAVNLQGEHELPGGIEESHEVDVLSVKGSLEAKAGISKDVVGATVSGEAGANLVEGTIEAKKTFTIPFTDIGIEIGGSGTGSVGANIGGEATAGFFKGEDGKSRVGLSAGFKAALGLGLGGKLSLNLVF